ncbi:MAG: D-hexose-6-phosphate mutarotase [Lentisphaeria bacterium]|nr:D-hexose-6-phosphate mutarotase [Lentisphaeria bacterium]
MTDEKTLAACGVTIDNNTLPFPVLNVVNSAGNAKISLYGGHVLSFAPAGERPVLWMSSKSVFEVGKPIRGGVPVCWPWFGPAAQDGLPGHGFARISMWNLTGVRKLAGDAVQVVLSLDESACDAAFCNIKFRLELLVTVGRVLELELRAFNTGTAVETYQAALHTYFSVSEAEKISIHGLDNVPYTDKAPEFAGERRVQFGDLDIDREIDRVFCPSSGSVAVSDPEFRRTIRVEKCGSHSTVVWNPWINKSRAMADFGDNEYHRMLCVECANVFDDVREVAPGGMTVMTQKISVEKWD